MTPIEKPFWKNCGEKEIMLVTSIFSVSPQCFQLCQRQKIIMLANYILLSANAFNLEKSKFFSFGKELRDGFCIFLFCWNWYLQHLTEIVFFNTLCILVDNTGIDCMVYSKHCLQQYFSYVCRCIHTGFPGVLFTSTLHNILSKPRAAFPQPL